MKKLKYKRGAIKRKTKNAEKKGKERMKKRKVINNETVGKCFKL